MSMSKKDISTLRNKSRKKKDDLLKELKLKHTNFADKG